MDRKLGWIKVHREICDSKIYKRPPLYLRLFERLIIEANHEDREIPFDRSNILVRRGERITSTRQIADWVAWYERGVLHIPNPKTIKQILGWLVKNESISMVSTATTVKSAIKSNSSHTHYKVINYEHYQGRDVDESNAESNSRVTVGKQLLDTNKNEKNEKNKDICSEPKRTSVSAAPIRYDFDKRCFENIQERDIAKWKETFPACNVELALKKMEEWQYANPKKRKRNYRRFIFNWLAREQDNGGTKYAEKQQPITKAERRIF